MDKNNKLFYYRGNVKVHFEPQPDLLGASLKAGFTGQEEEELMVYANELGLKREPAGESIIKDNVRIFRLSPTITPQARQMIQRRLSEFRYVKMVGPIIHISKENAVFLTNELVVKFKSHVTRENVNPVANQYNFNIVRPIPYAGNAFLFRSKKEASYDLLDDFAKVAQNDNVEYAEPNLVITMVDDQFLGAPGITDYLYGKQWYIPFVNLPEAWSRLAAARPVNVVEFGTPGDITFGSENIIIAVMDRGIISTDTGIALHPDFKGTITSKTTKNKVYLFYDFNTYMAPDGSTN
ncbi:MAG: hypothetical protein WA364_30165 [Candidatus Nitrosopolaris sp.]